MEAQPQEVTRVAKKKGGRSNRLMNGATYEPQFGRPMSQRVAHFLDWAAEHNPQEFLSYNVVAKLVNGFDFMPRIDSDEAERIKRMVTPARKILHKKYNRGLVTLPSVGIRATTDDFDRAKWDLTRKARALEHAADNFEQTAAAINPENIPKTGEAGLYREWVGHNVQDTRKRLNAADLKQRLLPPGSPDKK